MGQLLGFTKYSAPLFVADDIPLLFRDIEQSAGPNPEEIAAHLHTTVSRAIARQISDDLRLAPVQEVKVFMTIVNRANKLLLALGYEVDTQPEASSGTIDEERLIRILASLVMYDPNVRPDRTERIRRSATEALLDLPLVLTELVDLCRPLAAESKQASRRGDRVNVLAPLVVDGWCVAFKLVTGKKPIGLRTNTIPNTTLTASLRKTAALAATRLPERSSGESQRLVTALDALARSADRSLADQIVRAVRASSTRQD
jgi:hypothetical protein